MRRIFQYGKFQKTDLVFHTFSSGLGAFRFFPGAGHSGQFVNNSSISSPLLRDSSELNFPIEQIFASSPRVILAKRPSIPNEHGFQRTWIFL
jgi:hypothetical protein